MKHSVFVIAASLCLSVNLFSAVISEDFNADTPGEAPRSLTTREGDITVVDASTNPVDPFGPAENHSMAIRKIASGDGVPRATWKQIDFPTHGKLTLTAYSVSDEEKPNPQLNIFLIKDDINNIAISLFFLGSDAYVGNGSDYLTVEGVWILNAANEVVIEYFSNYTYSIFINGTILETSGGQTIFAFTNEIGDFNALQFATASTKRSGSEVFINDFEVTAVPEVSALSMLLFGSGLVGIFLVRR